MKYGYEPVSLSFPLFVHLHISETTWPNFLCILSVSVACSSIAIHYVLPVLWMTSCFRASCIPKRQHDSITAETTACAYRGLHIGGEVCYL